MPGAMPRADGPQFYRDIGIALSAVDGVSIRLDSLISLPGNWLLYLCALSSNGGTTVRPGRLAEDPFSVHGEDDRGGSYVGSYARNTRVLTPRRPVSSTSTRKRPGKASRGEKSSPWSSCPAWTSLPVPSS